jgi:hypothetical protein
MRFGVFLLPLAAFAQTPPSEVDQALRARVSEFYQSHVDGTFRKAIDLVAEDTKDYYIGTSKAQFKTFHIDSIQYSDNFTKADVQLTVEQVLKMRAEFPEMVVKVPSLTTWKIEDGKWVWYHDPTKVWTTPMGLAQVPAPDPNSKGTVQLPKVTASSIEAAARQILQQSSVDKSQVTLSTDKPSDQVVFHNGFPGVVRVSLDGGKETAGFTAELDKTELNVGENAIVKLRYMPKGKAQQPPISLRLIVEPFNQEFDISVTFGAPAQPPKP